MVRAWCSNVHVYEIVWISGGVGRVKCGFCIRVSYLGTLVGEAIRIVGSKQFCLHFLGLGMAFLQLRYRDAPMALDEGHDMDEIGIETKGVGVYMTSD